MCPLIVPCQVRGKKLNQFLFLAFYFRTKHTRFLMGAFLPTFILRGSLLKTISSEKNNFRENTGCHMGQVLLLRTQQASKLLVCITKETEKNQVGLCELKLPTTWND